MYVYVLEWLHPWDGMAQHSIGGFISTSRLGVVELHSAGCDMNFLQWKKSVGVQSFCPLSA